MTDWLLYALSGIVDWVLSLLAQIVALLAFGIVGWSVSSSDNRRARSIEECHEELREIGKREGFIDP